MLTIQNVFKGVAPERNDLIVKLVTLLYWAKPFFSCCGIFFVSNMVDGMIADTNPEKCMIKRLNTSFFF